MSPLTRGQTGISPVESAQSSILNARIGLFYCVFLRRLLGNRAHVIGILLVRVRIVGRDGSVDCTGHQLQGAVGMLLGGVACQRSDHDVLETDGAGNNGRSSGGTFDRWI